MPICGYLVLTEPGAADSVAARLAGLPGCEVSPVPGREALLLVTETADAEEDAALRTRVEATPGLSALLLTFGALDPHPSHAPAARDG